MSTPNWVIGENAAGLILIRLVLHCMLL